VRALLGWRAPRSARARWYEAAGASGDGVWMRARTRAAVRSRPNRMSAIPYAYRSEALSADCRRARAYAVAARLQRPRASAIRATVSSSLRLRRTPAASSISTARCASWVFPARTIAMRRRRKARRGAPRARTSRKRNAESESPICSYAFAAPVISPWRSRVDASSRDTRARAAGVKRSS
jgi:hypothetical protein